MTYLYDILLKPVPKPSNQKLRKRLYCILCKLFCPIKLTKTSKRFMLYDVIMYVSSSKYLSKFNFPSFIKLYTLWYKTSIFYGKNCDHMIIKENNIVETI